MALSPNPYTFEQTSPLETLVRRASSRRRPAPTLLLNGASAGPIGPQPSDLSFTQGSSTGHSSVSPPPDPAVDDDGVVWLATPPRAGRFDGGRPPSSPLLHTQFRASTATMATTVDASYATDPSHALGMRSLRSLADNESVYSEDTEVRQSRAESVTRSRSVLGSEIETEGVSFFQPTRWPTGRSSKLVYPSPEASPREDMPVVVISSPVLDPDSSHGSSYWLNVSTSSRVRRVPSAVPANTNFSRPNRSQASVSDSSASEDGPQTQEWTTSPSAPRRSVEDQAAKRRVLERNAHRSPSLRTSPPKVNPPSDHGHPLPVLVSSSTSTPATRRPDPVVRGGDTEASVYSTDSFYDLDQARRPPSPSSYPTPSPSPHSTSHHPPGPVPKLTITVTPLPPSSLPSRSQSSVAEDALQEGIRHHEANRLTESAACFERSATVGGGCGVGMLMWGLALRHGWGCKRDERRAFKWLMRAAESATGNLEMARRCGVRADDVQEELVMAIYEVGQCFFHAWGVPKDKKMAVSYFRVAARLGDPDAQNELAFCLVNGRGCKKDRKEAAKWYRAAVAQGASDIGLAWIYKDKFR